MSSKARANAVNVEFKLEEISETPEIPSESLVEKMPEAELPTIPSDQEDGLELGSSDVDSLELDSHRPSSTESDEEQTPEVPIREKENFELSQSSESGRQETIENAHAPLESLESLETLESLDSLNNNETNDAKGPAESLATLDSLNDTSVSRQEKSENISELDKLEATNQNHYESEMEATTVLSLNDDLKASLNTDTPAKASFEANTDLLNRPTLPSSAPALVEKMALQTAQNIRFEYDENEMVRLQLTIKQIREEREELLREIQLLKESLRSKDLEILGHKASLEEAKVEISLLKKRYSDQFFPLQEQLLKAQEKQALYQAQAKKLQEHAKQLEEKVRLDVGQVRRREKELEGQLELMSMDVASQIKGRDVKILELKQKIDALEFNMENAALSEEKAKSEAVKLEERLVKMMNTLRSSLQLFEEENEDRIISIKKTGKVGHGQR